MGKEKLNIVWRPSLPGNVSAQIDRANDIIYLSESARQSYTDDEYHAIILHEIGHDELDVDGSDEGEIWADNYAIAALKEAGKSVVPLYTALARSFPEDHPRIQNVKQHMEDQQIAAFNQPSLTAWQRKPSFAKVENFDPVTLTAGMGLVNNISSFLNNKRQGKDARAIAAANERAALDSNRTAIETARINQQIAKDQVQAALIGASAKTKNITRIIIGLAALAVVATVAIVIIKRQNSGA